ncbi:unnamed protein product [Effrenium voratum]|uniref:Thymus-specific serine protease n=1 Tax=Effrenium voratum TaxID=2562239 RepID=A0AA36JH43_9DINO|nr:unnamed protein product [Effrenium voratum]
MGLWNHLSPPQIDVQDPSTIRKFCGQKLDHFDPEDTRTWCQRYVVNRTHYEEGGPVFICIDGEDTPWGQKRRPYTLACNNMVELAASFKAAIVALEHRYYSGDAFDGVKDFSTKNLKYHSSRQALADLSRFHDYANKKYRTAGAPWVTFGGSYPGTLSAWARMLYPNKFVASVASSAPLTAEAVDVADFRGSVNYIGYLDVVSSALTAPSVGGTPECLATITEGHEQAIEPMVTFRRRELEKKFNLCGEKPLDSTDNIAFWAGNGVISTVPQYNSATCEHTSCNVKLLCGNLSSMRSSSDSAMDALEMMQKFQQDVQLGHDRHNPSRSTPVGFFFFARKELSITEKVNGSSPETEGMFGRLWTYQTCTEFGWYQTCEEGSNCPFTRGYNTIEWALDLCRLLFDISPEEVRENIESTNSFYGGADIDAPWIDWNAVKATRVVFPNGEVDPWHWEGCLVSPRPSVDTIFVKGASHCEWMHAEKPGMPEQLILAKSLARKYFFLNWVLNSLHSPHGPWSQDRGSKDPQ